MYPYLMHNKFILYYYSSLELLEIINYYFIRLQKFRVSIKVEGGSLINNLILITFFMYFSFCFKI